MSETPQEVEVSKDFAKLMDDMISDFKNTFPEYKGIIERWDVKYPSIDQRNKFLFNHCLKVLPERFFDILYKNNEMFESESSINTEFLPGIVFKQLWDFDISDKTKSTIWDYLQLMVFAIMNSVKDIKDFGDTAKLFEAINEDELKNKLQDTLEGLKSVFENKESMDPNNLPNPEDIHSHIQGMLGGKLGKLAMELAEETAKELEVDINDESSSQEAFKKLMSDPSKLMKMVNKVGGAIDTKIQSGELNKQELMKEGMDLLNKMQDIPGMENMQDIFNKMGLGKNVKLNTGAMQAKMEQMGKMEKMKERMRKNSEKKKMEKEAEKKMLEEINSLPAPPMLTDEQITELFGEDNSGVEKKTTTKKKKKNKK